ncbi:hypothetical protein [Seleniivibrio woodruffii]|uniref:hypothetical protein n=1 Tax=Seleniivibrio woodruffii TaxID=1078050 RepID=UPI00240926FA|nr:hypothetical protein [Seleniivibrio woodruffii]
MICDDITTTVADLLGGIKKADGYLTDAGNFVRDQPAVYPDEKDLPWVGVDYENIELPQDCDGGVTGMTLIVEVLTRPGVKLSDIVKDVMKVLKENRDLGGLAAEFFPQSSRKLTEQGQYRIGYCALKFTVNYITTDEWEF